MQGNSGGVLKFILIFLGGLLLGAALLWAFYPKTSINNVEDKVQQAQKKIFEEGVTIFANVDRVFQNGFILEDQKGEKMFVHWQDAPPKRGQKVQVKGVAKRVSDNITNLRTERGFSPELEKFLSAEQLFIEAQDVTAVVSTPTIP